MRGNIEEPAPLAEVLVERGPDRVVADVVGEIDMSNAEEVLQRLRVAADGAAALRIDLGRLTFLDSAAIAALDRLSRELSRGECRLTVSAPEGSVAARTLRLAGMDQVLPLAVEG